MVDVQHVRVHGLQARIALGPEGQQRRTGGQEQDNGSETLGE